VGTYDVNAYGVKNAHNVKRCWGGRLRS
jgi:hypothetical protein